MYPDDPKELGMSLSGATYVEDVNEVCLRDLIVPSCTDVERRIR